MLTAVQDAETALYSADYALQKDNLSESNKYGDSSCCEITIHRWSAIHCAAAVRGAGREREVVEAGVGTVRIQYAS